MRTLQQLPLFENHMESGEPVNVGPPLFCGRQQAAGGLPVCLIYKYFF